MTGTYVRLIADPRGVYGFNSIVSSAHQKRAPCARHRGKGKEHRRTSVSQPAHSSSTASCTVLSLAVCGLPNPPGAFEKSGMVSCAGAGFFGYGTAATSEALVPSGAIVAARCQGAHRGSWGSRIVRRSGRP